MKKLPWIALLLCIAVGLLSAAEGEFKIRRLTEFMEPENIRPGKFKLEAVTPDLVKLTPEPGEKEVVLTLKEDRKIDDDTGWFSIPVYPVSPEKNPSGLKVVLNTPSSLGENGITTVTFPYHRNHSIQRGWENLVSENTLLGLHPSRRKGMKMRALHFRLVPGVEAVYFRTPQLYSNTNALPELASAYDKIANTWYGEMAPILPFRYLPGSYECTLALQDGYQKQPFYVAVKPFDFGPEKGEGFDPAKALEGFQLPVMPAGTYWCTLTFRDPKTGKLLKKEEFDYEVLASPAKALPAFPDHTPGADLLGFASDAPDFIFDAGTKVAGRVRVPDLTGCGWINPKDTLRVECTLLEYAHRETQMPLEVYQRQTLDVPREGGELRLEFPVTEAMAPQNQAFQLALRLYRGAETLLSTTYTVGVRGKDNSYRPPEGKILTWQEMFQKPMLGEGPHPLRWFHRDEMEIFAAKVAKEGYSKYVDIDCMWSGNTEPLPGFHTYGYIDRFLNVLRKHGLHAIMHTSGIDQPRWSYFHNEPSRLHDGRFLRGDTWSPSPTSFDVNDVRTRSIHGLITRLGRRYAKDPAVGFWVFWGYGGEGFTSDWALSWRYGGGVTGYCLPGIRNYRNYLQEKYREIAALNRTYGTAYASWEEVPPPLPPIEKESKRLRNPRPVHSLPYEDFKAAKEKLQRDYFEIFIARDFRKIDPNRPFALYYYGDAETEYMRTTPEFFKNNPGLIQRNGGNEIAGVWNKQYMHFRAYENTPTMSEDVRVYADTLKDWQSNVFNGARIGRLGVHFFNYSLILARMKEGKPEVYHTDHHHPAIAKFFQGLQKEALPVLGETTPLPPRVAVYYNYYDNPRTGTCPANELFRSRHLAEPLNDRFIDRLEKHYRVLAFDSGAQVIPEKVAKEVVRWVKNGGTLLLTPATAVWQQEKLSEPVPNDSFIHQPLQHDHYLLNELGLPLPKEGKWAAKVAGTFTGKTASPLYFPRTPELKFLDGVTTYLFPKGGYPQAEVLGELTSPEAVAGSPCILKFQVGKGQVFLFSQYPRIAETEFYGDLLAALKVPRYLSFAGAEGEKDADFNRMLGYALEETNNSRVLMVQFANNAPDPHFNPTATQEKEPFRRRIRAHELPAGSYEVFDLTDGKVSLGRFSAADLGSKGIPAEFRFNELKIFQLIRK